MENYNQNIEDLVAKYLAGEANADELALLMQWRNASKENYSYFENLERIFHESAAIKNLKAVDTDAAWNKLKREIRKSEVGSEKLDEKDGLKTLSKTSGIKILYRIAAVFVIAVLSVTTYLFLTKENINTVTITAGNETKMIVLPDSSTVFLNKNSMLAYAYSKEKREINLTGEAFFDVKHDAEKPFLIHANDLEIKDIGTTFNVKAMQSSDSVEVIVESGEVELKAAINPDYNYVYRVTPGQQAVFNKKTKRIVKTKTRDSNATAYRTKVFVFENASLQAATQKLTEVYGAEIILSDKIKGCHITSTFKNEKIDAVMDVIASTLNLKLTKKENKFLLEGDGCEE